MNERWDDFARALAGDHALVLPVDRGGEVTRVPPSGFDDAGTGNRLPALVVHTSGSTGTPKAVALSASALEASGRATERFLAGPGRWYLTLPTNHIAGAQVGLRSLMSGTVPVESSGPFTAAGFADGVARLLASGPGPYYASIVPTQLSRIMTEPIAVAAARGFDAILLGGAAISPSLLARAEAAGLPIVRTYGMSETCGGCVYDGRPFDEVSLRIDAAGRVELTGSVLADGYLEEGLADDGPRLRSIPVVPDPAGTSGDDSPTGFLDRDGNRVFVSSDLGRIDDGVLSILGRADDVIVVGGEKIAPLHVENLLLAALEPHGVREVLVSGVPDEEWGHILFAHLVGDPDAFRPETVPEDAPDSRALAEAVARVLGPDFPGLLRPRHAALVDALPTTSIGKPDRRTAARTAARIVDGTHEV